MTKTPAVRCSNVSYTYTRWGRPIAAISDLTLDVPRGQWVTVVGPNGSGKSTLLTLIAGQRADETGSIEICGSSTTGLSDAQLASKVYFVRQDPTAGSAPLLSVRENLWVADPTPDRGAAARQRREARYAAMLAPFGLDDALDQLAATLSGGQRQLLTLLIASLRKASIVLLDEPLAALDPQNAGRCVEVMRDLHAAGRTLINVTHDRSRAMGLGQRTIGLRSGKLVYDAAGAERDAESLEQVWRPPQTDHGE